ncbi:uncharacterized protein Z518_11039 [Rhinocladiella mackenziei CBS 650.93]|uniref:Pre-mRNA splicing factor CLF1 n=1 Tax=Rhinocladiella mackenziei CBS 650.93 TaxID=1442369 RepID=A0A0D2FBZ0_9EURO|nr:uncharacterized protein Z518_11039 [Rhinocladiella mackenziei CBS 650.93]KIW99626.1 hypothetical protein Z518_11039 [Rhinocladiella mackenziei CBS 650.93]
MSAPKPPVALKDHCSIIHDGVIYVYSPDAFQTLELKEGAEWKQERNGVSVTGAVCVKGGLDGNNSRPALYVVGGSANQSSSDYPGLQRFSIADKSWQTITPVVPVTQYRQNHGAAYMNASSSLVVYGGSQDGYTGPSSETFTLEMYPPYRVLAYSSTAPPTVKPFMLPWTDNRALMIGGSSTNVNIFTFGPTDGWQDLGLSLPNPLPNYSVAQSALFTLDDSSKILQTFDLGQSPPTVTTNVLLNPGGLPASFGETVGGSNATAAPSPVSSGSSKSKRAVFLNDYPTYNDTLAPSVTRTGFDIAQGDDGLVAFIGGNDKDPVVFFNQSDNGWIAATQLLGEQQAPLATPSSSGSAPFPNSSTTGTTPASSGSSDKSRDLTVLGAVLGGICGAAAILIILLLWMRTVRRKREQAQKQMDNPDDKGSGEYNYEERGLHPLSKAGQPMGRSPVPSAVISEADSTAMFGGKPDPKYLIRRVSLDRAQPGFRGSGIGFGQAMFKREKGRLNISKPMMPVLGDDKERPSIELGKATPAQPAAVKAGPARKASQRKTDEGWGKYFQGEAGSGNRTTFISRSSGATTRGKSEFWPGSGVPENAPRSTRLVLRDSVGNPLEAQNVAAGSPSLEHGPANPQSKGLQAAQGIPARISHASSITTTNSDDDDYEDDRIDGAFSSGVPASVRDMPWTPVGNTWSGPPQRPLVLPGSYVTAQGRTSTTASSNEMSDNSARQDSSIPSFPMPNSIRSTQPGGGSAAMGNAGASRAMAGVSSSENEARDYFSHVRARSKTPDNSDMSWLNLGTPTR